jgi:hypothetical protein
MLGRYRRSWEDNIKMDLTIKWKEGNGLGSSHSGLDMWQILVIDAYQ